MSDAFTLTDPIETFEEQAAPATKVRGYWESVYDRLRHDPVTLVFGAIVLLIVLAAVLAPLIALFNPYQESIIGRLKPFGWRGHLLGTDELGRDMLSRLIFGGRVSLLMGVVPVLIAALIGGMLGVIGGFVGGRANTVIMRTMDVFYAFPSVLLAVAIAGAMGGGIGNGMLALTLVFIPPMCRVAETATTQIRALDFIEAARASGAKTGTIIRYHVLGNVWARYLFTPHHWLASASCWHRGYRFWVSACAHRFRIGGSCRALYASRSMSSRLFAHCRELRSLSPRSASTWSATGCARQWMCGCRQWFCNQL
jgi:ABC-type dipeptide/oligopeptide/nickel transport system permease subunit